MIDGLEPEEFLEREGLSAIFRTRAAADLAVEHLVQEYGLDPSTILVEPVEGENSVGVEVSGGDHASGKPSHDDKTDAPLHGAIRLTLQFEHQQLAHVQQALRDCGAVKAEAY